MADVFGRDANALGKAMSLVSYVNVRECRVNQQVMYHSHVGMADCHAALHIASGKSGVICVVACILYCKHSH